MTWDEFIYDVATGRVSTNTIREAAWSYLPGRENGPADAYRHILLAAELTRRFGEEEARRLLDAHEWTGEWGGQTPEAEAMDIHNNELGIALANELSNNPDASWLDIVYKARELIDPLNRDGDGAQWLDESTWDKNPTDEFGNRIPTGDPRLNWPVEWTYGPYYNDFYDPDAFPDNHTTRPDFTVNTLYNAAQEWMSPPPPRRRIDPLVLDLDGDGIETVGITSTSHVVFDGEGDGLKTGSGWVGKDDGLLVFDRNGNGVIDNGSELFGDQTLVNGVKATDGFSALAGEDTNSDGVFNATDTNYANVRVWQDLNQDGISQTTELKTLTDLSITSINLTSTATNITTNGNLQTATSTYTKTDGTTKAVGNLNFVQNAFYREYTDPLPLTDAALALPDMQGSGLVRDLREASTLSAGLSATLQSMSTTYETHDAMMAQVDTLLAQWASTSSINNQNFKNQRRVA